MATADPASTPGNRPGPEEWDQIRALFDEALGLPPEDRLGFLDGITASARVREEVRSLLAQAALTGPLDSPASLSALAPASSSQRFDQAPSSREGERLGAWQISRLLGRGGMGEVWLASRCDGAYDGQAAIKVLRRGMDSSAVLARFAQEQQALARLSHPHIACLLDAGRTADGLPYFVMEHVPGVPISTACEGRDLEARLALFLQLAQAVAYAHRQLLVHRDLKPGNVLVMQAGGNADTVKLLDFGIAKALDPLEGAADASLTQAGERPYTPHYASPEQVRGEPVSTATDIYSLGVLLYVMLTGTRPYGRDASTPQQAARSVLEEPPTRPSALSPDWVKDPQWLQTRRRLEGDLDNILLKALDKSIEGRYPSVDALAADVRAFLDGFPVSAQPPSLPYRARKFFARNRWATAGVTLGLLGLLTGLAASLWQAQRAEEQRALAERRFQEVRRFARTMLFDVDTALKNGPTAGREKLVTTAQEYLDRLAQEQHSDADLLRDLAEGYERVGEIQGGAMHANVGRPEDARRSLLKALALRERLMTLQPQDERNRRGLFSVHERLGDSLRAAGDLPGAAQHYERAVAEVRLLSAAHPQDLPLRLRRFDAERYLASVYYWPLNRSLGEHARARPIVQALAKDMQALLQEHPTEPKVLEAAGGLLNQWSDFQRLEGDFAGALQTQRASLSAAQALAARDAKQPTWQRWLYLAEGRLADALIETGAVDEGLAMWRQSIEHREALAQADPGSERAQRNVANGYGPLAEQLANLGRDREALPWYRKEHALLTRLRREYPQVNALGPRLDESQRDLALALAMAGETAQAWSLSQALQARRQAQTDAGEDSALRAKFRIHHARVALRAPVGALSSTERRALAETALSEVRALSQAADAEPFNAILAREAAATAQALAADLLAAGDRQGCDLQRQARTQLQALHHQARLPAVFAAVLLSAPSSALSGCAAP